MTDPAKLQEALEHDAHQNNIKPPGGFRFVDANGHDADPEANGADRKAHRETTLVTTVEAVAELVLDLVEGARAAQQYATNLLNHPTESRAESRRRAAELGLLLGSVREQLALADVAAVLAARLRAAELEATERDERRVPRR